MRLTPLQLLKKRLNALEIEQRKLSKASGVENRMKQNAKLTKTYKLAIAVLETHPNFKSKKAASIVIGTGKNEI